MEWYLVFDGGCSVCGQLASAIDRAAAGKLKTISISENRAKDLLDSAYPGGWDFAPYLVRVDNGRTSAWKGGSLAVRLGWILGPRKAWKVWSLARRRGVLMPPSSPQAAHRTSRRHFLKSSAIMAAVLPLLVQLGLQPNAASACVPCADCTMKCYAAGCVINPCIPQNGVCQAWDCYDDLTHEYCGRYASNCCCACSCA